MKAKLTFSLLIACTMLFAQPAEIKVWPGKIPGSIDNAKYKETVVYGDNNSPRISRVTDPTLIPYIVPKEKANGTAVIICPGGGYSRLAIDHEGYQVAQWFNEMGISAFVLKYRLPHDSIMQDKSVGPLQDAQEAIRLVRRKAKEWGIEPNKIGIMGFSAGGHLASTLSTHYAEVIYPVSDSVSARPDFSVLVYPVVTMDSTNTHSGSRTNLIGKRPLATQVTRFSNELQVNAKTPPAFLVHALDDKTVPVQNSINYLLALKKNNVRGEMHVYQQGGHGFGLAKNKGTESTWPEALKNWLKVQKLL